MKNVKKLFAILLAVVVVLSISTSALAYATPETDAVNEVNSTVVGDSVANCCVGDTVGNEDAVIEEAEARDTAQNANCPHGCGLFLPSGSSACNNCNNPNPYVKCLCRAGGIV